MKPTKPYQILKSALATTAAKTSLIPLNSSAAVALAAAWAAWVRRSTQRSFSKCLVSHNPRDHHGDALLTPFHRRTNGRRRFRWRHGWWRPQGRRFPRRLPLWLKGKVLSFLIPHILRCTPPPNPFPHYPILQENNTGSYTALSCLFLFLLVLSHAPSFIFFVVSITGAKQKGVNSCQSHLTTPAVISVS